MTRKGVWNLQQVRDKYLQSLWVNDTSIFSWGDNGQGQSGTNTSVKISSPTQVAGDWTSASLSNGGRSDGTAAGAVKSDGTLYTWGYNNNGELGQNAQGSNAKLSSPTQVGSDSTWAHVSMGGDSALATNTDGTMWAWGINDRGNLGINNKVKKSSPTQVPGTTWNIGVMAENVGMAVRTDGTLWAMGLNSNGEFGGPPLNIAGTGSPGWRSSPIQIPGTWGTDELLIVDHTLFALKSDLTPSQL